MKAEFEFDVICIECGDDLVAEQKYNGDIEVYPCEECLKNAKKESYDEGYAEGEAECDN